MSITQLDGTLAVVSQIGKEIGLKMGAARRGCVVTKLSRFTAFLRIVCALFLYASRITGNLCSTRMDEGIMIGFNRFVKGKLEEGILWNEIRCCILTNSLRNRYKYKFVLLNCTIGSRFD